MPRSSVGERSRLNLMPLKTDRERLEALGPKIGASNITETILKLLDLGELVANTMEEGGRVILENSQGNQETVRLFR